MRRRLSQIAAIFIGVLIIATIARPEWLIVSDSDLDDSYKSGQNAGDVAAPYIGAAVLLLISFLIIRWIWNRRHQ